MKNRIKLVNRYSNVSCVASKKIGNGFVCAATEKTEEFIFWDAKQQRYRCVSAVAQFRNILDDEGNTTGYQHTGTTWKNDAGFTSAQLSKHLPTFGTFGFDLEI